jgi:hypothetical protein
MKVWVAHARQVQGHEQMGTLVAVGDTQVAAEMSLKAHIESIAEHFDTAYDDYVEEHIEFEYSVEVEVSTDTNLKHAGFIPPLVMP